MTSAHPPKPPIETRESKGGDELLQHADRWAKAGVLCSVLLVLIGAAYSCFDYGQREVMNAQLEAMRAQQLARVSMRELSVRTIVDPAVVGKVVGMQLIPLWINSGTTPATSAFTRVNFQSDVPKQGFDYGDRAGVEPREVVLGPNAAAPMVLSVGIAQVAAVNHGHPISVWGWMTYRDVFDATPIRLTEFCFEIEAVEFRNSKDIRDPVGSIVIQYTLCRTHNCYDQNCPDYQKHVK